MGKNLQQISQRLYQNHSLRTESSSMKITSQRNAVTDVLNGHNDPVPTTD